MKAERIKQVNDEFLRRTGVDFSRYRNQELVDTVYNAQCEANKKPPILTDRGFSIWRLAVTYSHTGSPALPSAMLRFTAEFGMGSGGTKALLPPGKLAELGVRVKIPVFRSFF
jgi:hypothetical protein